MDVIKYDDICANCGGAYEIHSAKGERCPKGGYEAPPNRDQEWAETTFLDRKRKQLNDEAPNLLRIAKYAQTIAKDNNEPFPIWADQAIARAEGQPSV